MDISAHYQEGFSLSAGGPFNRVLERKSLHNWQGKLAVVGLCLTWLPLVVITLVEGTLYNNQKTYRLVTSLACHKEPFQRKISQTKINHNFQPFNFCST